MRGDIRSTRASTRTRAATIVVTTMVLAVFGIFGALPGAPGGQARAATASRFEPTPTTAVSPPTTSGPTAPASTGAPSTVPETTPDTAVVDTTPATAPAVTDAVTYQDPGNGGQTADPGQQQGQTGQQTSDSAPMTTTEDLLVGPSTTPAPSTTAPRQDLTTTAVTRKGGSSDPKIWMIVAALVLVAFGLGLATVLYWRRTRPEAVDGPRKRGSRFSDLVITVPKSS